MKKMFLAVAAIAITTAAFSQVRFGIQAIGNAGTASIKSDEMKNANTNFKIGAGGGVVADYSVSEKFGVRTSLNFLQKKSELTYQTEQFDDKPFSVNSTLNYLELPIYAVYKIPLNKMKVFVGAGPSFGYGISGKLKAKGWMEADGEGDQIDVVPVSAEIDAFKKEEDDGAGFKRFDISASAIAGVEFKNGLYAHAGYTHGFSNIGEGVDYKNRGIQLTVGFLLPSKK